MAGVKVSIIGAMCTHCQTIVLHIVRSDAHVNYIGTNPKCTTVPVAGLDFECGAPMAELEASEIDTIFDSHKVGELAGDDS